MPLSLAEWLKKMATLKPVRDLSLIKVLKCYLLQFLFVRNTYWAKYNKMN